MITIYNEYRNKDKKDDHIIREYIEDYFETHEYLNFTNISVWIKEANPQHSRGQVLFECAVEARLPGKDPVYVSKKNDQMLIAAREALDTLKEEIIKTREKVNDRTQIHKDEIL